MREINDSELIHAAAGLFLKAILEDPPQQGTPGQFQKDTGGPSGSNTGVDTEGTDDGWHDPFAR